MKLLIDLQALQNGSRNRGIGRYVRSLFDALAKRDDIKLFALLNGAMADTLKSATTYAADRIGAERVLVFPGLPSTSDQYPANKHRRLLSELFYEAFVAETGCDALLAGSAVEGFTDDTIVSLTAPSAGYLRAAIFYDAIPLTSPEEHLRAKFARNWYDDRMRHLHAADLLLAISAFSRSEAVTHLNRDASTVVEISTAIDKDLFCADGKNAKRTLAKFGLSKPFLMHASVIDPRKNFDGLVTAFGALPAKVRNKHQLLLAGPVLPDMESHLRKLAAAAGVAQSDLIIPGQVTDEDLLALYRSCRLFVFPSFFEGFGLPALEAMACGAPAIGSNVTSIPEVIGNPAYTFDPHDTEEMAALITTLLTDKKAWLDAKAHAVSHAACFSWEKVASSTVEAIRGGLADREPLPVGYPSASRMGTYVANGIDLDDCASSDVEALARHLSAGEDELITKCAAAFPKKKPWRIEGTPFDTTYSLALVNRETALAMSKLGWDVALQSGEGNENAAVSQEFLAANPDLVPLYERAGQTSQQSSFATSRMNYPPRTEDMSAPINALHHYAWEETGFPHRWVEEFNENLTMMTTLSTHVEKILIDNGVCVPMVTSGCGVDHWERIKADPNYRVDARSFRFLHVSSCFPRKGINALLEAYGAAFSIDDDVSLVIKTFDNPHNEVLDVLSGLKAQNSQYPDVVTIFGDLSDAQVKALYSQCHVMVGPSFAEGYGLPFAEAMLSGIPVITTNWGGQLDFCNSSNSWLVDYRFERANSHLGVWSSAWARVDVQALARAMREAREASVETRAAMAARGRHQLMERHTWKHVAERLTASAATLPARPRRDPQIGWISTWNSKCGIATYSQHLIDAIPADVTVFSPEKEATLIGKDQSHRLWRVSKSLSRLGRILASPHAADIDVFVIQFNYGFYNHADLANFIYQAKDRGKAVILCLHATYEIGLQPYDNFQLSYIAPALAACDRILVHSVNDLNNLKRLGLVDNVALFPHGVLRRGSRPEHRVRPEEPVIATYGFAMPHKGLSEVLEAVRLLRKRGRKVRLKMVNAEYPAEVSAAEVHALNSKIRNDGLSEFVEMHNEFLSDERSLELLTDSDLVVFAYQNTEESASGAVRYGMAVERPVAVTPLPIFDDLAGATFRMKGTSPSDIADGIAAALDALASDNPEAKVIEERAEAWRSQHDYRIVGRRLFNMCKALASR